MYCKRKQNKIIKSLIFLCSLKTVLCEVEKCSGSNQRTVKKCKLEQSPMARVLLN